MAKNELAKACGPGEMGLWYSADVVDLAEKKASKNQKR